MISNLWVFVIAFCLVLSVVLGYINIYIPGDQKNKAVILSKANMGDELSDDNLSIAYRRRMSSRWYLILAGLFSCVVAIVLVSGNYVAIKAWLGTIVFARVATMLLFGLMIWAMSALCFYIGEDLVCTYLAMCYDKYGIDVVSEKELYEGFDD